MNDNITTAAQNCEATCAICHERLNDLVCEQCGAPLCETCWCASPYGTAWEREAIELGERGQNMTRPVLCPACATTGTN